MRPYYQRGPVTLFHADCLEWLPTLEPGAFDVVITDPPYGMGKGEWDQSIPNWMPLVAGKPIATFCGVVGMRDYETPDWVGAWVRVASTQRCGRLRGFNNWEPILFFNIPELANDVISEPNIHEKTGHPTTKPTRLMEKLIERMPAGVVCDPFTGSGTTALACIRTGRQFIGCELSEEYCDIAAARIDRELDQGRLFDATSAVVETQADLFAEVAA